MKKAKLIILSLVSVFSLAAQAQSEDNYFRNPVMNQDCPDPTLVRHTDGSYYLLSTGCPIYRSKDLVKWTYVKGAFQGVSAPNFVQGGGIWAPDISYINDQYVIHYSMSKWGGEWECGIGVAVSKRPYGPYTDLGKLFISSEIDVQNSIDPFYIEDEDGKKYLFWGSFRGIYAIELSDDGLAIKEGAEKKKIAGTLIEGTYIHKRDGYYYLIGSSGSCCDGNNSTYQLVVARSKTLLGPYYDKSNKSALNNGFTLMLKGDGNVAGPGHCSEIVTDDAGQDWIFYHGYRRDNPDNGRVLHLDRVKWDSEGWPYIETEKPSEIAEKPVFEEKTYTYSPVDYIDFVGESENFRHLFDTGYVPKSTTRVELDCMSYDKDKDGNKTSGEWRAVFSGRHSNNNGYSLYVNPNGIDWGYFAGGFIGDNIGAHEYNKKYTTSASLKSLVVDGETFPTNRRGYVKTYQRMTLFSGVDDYPYYGRIYSFRIYEDDALVHDYAPMLRNEDQVVVFYDKVTQTYMTPTTPSAFSYGSIVSGIEGVESDKVSSSEVYNLQGQKVASGYKGIVIENGKKMIRK